MDSQSSRPKVSFVIPVFNDEKYIKQAITSCLNQTLKDVEVVCVDDKSSDNTPEIIQQIASEDSRVRLIQHDKNMSALQARRTGIENSQADYILFLDGDDEFHKDTAQLTYTQAVETNSDLVGFGLEITSSNGRLYGFEKNVRPTHSELLDEDILKNLFEPGRVAQGQAVRYLYRKPLLKKVYANIPKQTAHHRAEDLLVSFQAAIYAKKYTSIDKKLYIYHMYRGESKHSSLSIEQFDFYISTIDTLDLLGKIISEKIGTSPVIADSYRSARLSTVSSILNRMRSSLSSDKYSDALKLILKKINLQDIILATASFNQGLLDILRENLDIQPASVPHPKNIALFTSDLSTGGLQAVVVAQSQYLHEAGYDVTIIVRVEAEVAFAIPKGVRVVQLGGSTTYQSLENLIDIFKKHNIDTLIDHGVIYNNFWPFRNLVARSLGVQTIAWAHNFSLRSTHDTNELGDFMYRNMTLLDKLVVLSHADVTFWKSLGYKEVYYLPNPPSGLITESDKPSEPKQAPANHLNLLWYGRLHQQTKKVLGLLDIAHELSKTTRNFTLKVVGPDGPDLTKEQLQEAVARRGLTDLIEISDALHGTKLVNTIKNTNILLNVSDIEGYPITLMEAQYFGVPVVMYELPWLELVKNNKGIIQSPQGRPDILAQEILKLTSHEKSYEQASVESLKSADKFLCFDFSLLYSQLLTNSLPKEFSPAKDSSLIGLFLSQTLQFTKNAALSKKQDEKRYIDAINYTEELLENYKVKADDANTRIKRLEQELKEIKSSRKYKIVTRASKVIGNIKSTASSKIHK